MKSLRKRTVANVLWNAGQQFFGVGISFLATIALAALLVPSDMGLVAMAGLFLAVGAGLAEAGFTEALIRKQDAKPIDFNTAFWANLAIASTVYLIIFLCAPLIAAFYEDERLIDIVRVASVAILIGALRTVQVAILRRNMEFKRLLYSAAPAGVLAAAAAVLLAFYGFGYWALVAQSLISVSITTAWLWWFSSWRPRFEFSVRSFSTLAGFGSRVAGANLLLHVGENMVTLVVGKMFSPTVTGLFVFADRIYKILGRHVVSAIQTVTYSAMVTIQDDAERLRNGYRSIIRVTTFAVFPILICTIAFAGLIFEVILPDRWHDAIELTRLLCIAGLLFPLYLLNGNILKVKGKAGTLLITELIKRSFLIAAVIAGGTYGIEGVAFAHIVYAVLTYVMMSAVAAPLIGYKAHQQLADAFPAFAGSVAAAGAGMATQTFLQLQPFAALVTVGTVAGLTYLGLAAAFRLEGLHLLIETVRKGKGSASPGKVEDAA